MFDYKLFRRATNKLLQNLSLKLHDFDKRLSDYGLPEPKNSTTELQIAYLQYDENEQILLLQQLKNNTPNTTEQDNIFTFIINKIDN